VPRKLSGRPIDCPRCRRRIAVTAPPEAEPDESDEVTIAEGEGTSAVLVTFQTVKLVAGLLALIALAAAAIIGLISLRQNPEPVRRTLGQWGDALTDLLASGSSLILAFFIVLAAITYLVLVIGMAAWVSRDAHNRNHTGLGWAVFYLAWRVAFAVVAVPLLAFRGLGLPVLAFGWVGFLIYLGGRRPGYLVRCPHCKNKRLEYVLCCPHCGK
jgi:hypothetical protein